MSAGHADTGEGNGIMTNKYAGECRRCGRTVPTGAGTVSREGSVWRTYCADDVACGEFHAARWASVQAEIAESFALANETALAARDVNATSDVLMASHNARERANRARVAGMAECFAADRTATRKGTGR